ncbi:HK97 family phage prohead protease [Microbacterium sp. SS28]|uniref:HK97 family phage prohead protease n=1 Tax=Microbacterium sp. SS28 TaxID=2919948 RepID=UPI001FAA22B5|nr:HK97 family phage prohead protease [Microbacterium sp. SS28]
MTEVERRYTPIRVDLRTTGERRAIGGYAAKFSPAISRNLGGFVERIAPGFFDRSKGEGWPNVLARYNHDDNMLLGTSDAGTLRLAVDNVGLLYDVDLPSTREDVYELVQRGDVRQSSFAFAVDEDDWTQVDGYPLRTLVSGRLFDVAPVNTPAYPDTSVALRSLAKRYGAPLDEVRAMSDAGTLGKLTGRGGSAHIALTKAMRLQGA